MNYLDKITSNYEASLVEYLSLLTRDNENELLPPAKADGLLFGKDFPGKLIQKPFYTKCIFVCSNFVSSDGILSRFHECNFKDCFFSNCDFRYCDFIHNIFKSEDITSSIKSCNFSYGNIIDSEFNGIIFDGCSFRQMQLEKVRFVKSTFNSSSIEQSIISNCCFDNVDLSRSVIRYCTFDEVDFYNVKFHILDLPKNYGLVKLIDQAKGEVSIIYGNGIVISLSEALSRLHKLITYYFETNQFYESVNLCAIYNDYETISGILPIAFKTIISNYDFPSLEDLCSLIVNLDIFTSKQLREFYNAICELVVPEKLPHYLIKSHNTYMENIKNILVSNPNNYPTAHILLKTNILSLGDSDIVGLLKFVEISINEAAPNAVCSIELTHHSPYDVLVVLHGLMPELLLACQMLYYSLGGIKSYIDIKHSCKEKTNNNLRNAPGQEEKTMKTVELSLGKNFSLKYHKEYIKRVETMEYTIK